VIIDFVGFVVAIWLRGVCVVHVFIMLAGMVDVAVGGKIGINIIEGKNLVGVFYLLVGVLCDLMMFEMLSRNDFVVGFVEVVKCGFIVDFVIFEVVECDFEVVMRWDVFFICELVECSVRVKVDVVG